MRTIVNLSDAVKSGAVSLSSDNAEAQVMVIHAGMVRLDITGIYLFCEGMLSCKNL